MQEVGQDQLSRQAVHRRPHRDGQRGILERRRRSVPQVVRATTLNFGVFPGVDYMIFHVFFAQVVDLPLLQLVYLHVRFSGPMHHMSIRIVGVKKRIVQCTSVYLLFKL